MPLYEHVFLARQDVSAQQVEKLMETYQSIIKDNGGSVGKTEYWGLKNLAYRIKKKRKAHYALMNIDAPHEAVAEMERQMRIEADVIRFLTLRVDELDDSPSAMMKRQDRDDRRGPRRDRDGRDGDRGRDNRDTRRGGDRPPEAKKPADAEVQKAEAEAKKPADAEAQEVEAETKKPAEAKAEPEKPAEAEAETEKPAEAKAEPEKPAEAKSEPEKPAEAEAVEPETADEKSAETDEDKS